MVISHQIRDDIVVIGIDLAELRASSSVEFKRRVLEVLEACDSVRVVLDLSGVDFIDSSGLGALLSVLRYLTTKGGDLKLACLNDAMLKMMKRVRLQKVIELYKTVDEAVGAFAEDVDAE